MMQHHMPEVQNTSMNFLTVFGMEQLLKQNEESTIATIYNDDKTDSSNYAGMSVLSTTYRIFSSILLSRLTPYVDEINGDHLHNNYNYNLFSIPEIHQSGYRTCQQITIGMVQNECQQ